MAWDARERWRTVSTTVVLTSLGWLAFGFWLWPHSGGFAPTQLLSVERGPAPVRTGIAPDTSARLVIPVAGVRTDQLRDTFSEARAAGARRHDAIDIMAPVGTPVLAAAPGRIEKLFLSKDGGLTIYLRPADRRTIHYYAHLERYAPGLAEGQVVRAGQRLGSVGFSGNANPLAPHLHFAVMRIGPDAPWYRSGEAINPYPLMRGR